MKERKKKKSWTRKRHRHIRNILSFFLSLYIRLRYGITVDRFKEQRKEPYLILMNHQTPFDQFFVGMAFKGAVYYMATEDIFSNGFVSSLIRYLVAPIPIKKQTTDVKAILNCIKVAKEGGTLAIAPEGNRTYSGRTEYMSPSIAPLARKLGLPIALFRIEGGYGTQPRWSDAVRRGRMRGYVARVIEPGEYASLTDEELFGLIRDGLYVDEAVADRAFHHRHRAEYLERAIYVCPFCGLSSFESRLSRVRCLQCGRQVEYLPTKELRGEGFDFPYRFAADWYDAQKEFINGLDVTALCDSPVYRDTARMSEVIVYKRKVLLHKRAALSLYGDRIEIRMPARGSDRGREAAYVFPFDATAAVTVLGRNKLNVYFGGKVYQIKGDKRFNALKYVHFFHRYQNLIKGDGHGQFLGL